jgi:hypothetical protein
MGKKILKRLHILCGVADELVLRETGNVYLDIPLILAFMEFLVYLEGFLEFVLFLFFYIDYSFYPITNPFHITLFLEISFYNISHNFFSL